jgi:hypothetical protein
MPRIARAILAMVAAAGCGVRPDPAIADAIVSRVRKDAPGWSPLACPDRARKVERLRPIVPVVHDLTGRVRDYGTPLPPASRARLRTLDLVGAAADYRCVVQDFHAVDLATEPNYLAGQHNFANLYLLEARERIEGGDPDGGWALVLEAFELFRTPRAHQLGEHFELAEALALVAEIAAAHPPRPPIAERVADAVDATFMPRKTLCTALRHDLLTHVIPAVRGHLGPRDREAIVGHWGRGYARLLLEAGKPGLHDRASVDAWVRVYDAIAPTCAKQPLARVVRQAAPAVDELARVDPLLGRGAEAVLERLRRYDLVAALQRTTAARLRGVEPWPPVRVSSRMPSPYAPP